MKNIYLFGLLFLNGLIINNQVNAQINGATTACMNQSTVYTSGTAAHTYIWNANGAVSSSQNQEKFTVKWGTAASGSISLSTYNQNNVLTGSWTAQISLVAQPNPVIISNFKTDCFDAPEQEDDSCFAACVNSPMIYSTPFATGNAYSWEVIGSSNYTLTSADGNEIEVIWPNLGVQYLRLTVTNSSGCSNTYSKCVRTIEKPTALIGSTPAEIAGEITVCKNSEVYLQDLSSESVSRSWDFGDGESSVKLSPTHTYTEAGIYTVVLTARNSCYCFDRDTLTVNVEETEGPEIVCPAVVCDGDTATYFTPSGCSSFLWSATNGTIIGDSTGNTVEVVWNDHVGFIHLQGISCPGSCIQPTTEKIAVVNDTAEILGAQSICNGSEGVYSVVPMPGSTYEWSVHPDLGTIVDSNDYEITVKFNGSGASGGISVIYSNAIAGCGGSASINVQKKPVLAIDAPDEVCFNDTTTLAISDPINWDLRDSNNVLVGWDTNTTQISIPWNAYGSGTFKLSVQGGSSFCNNLETFIKVLPQAPGPDTIFGSNSVCGTFAYTYHIDPKDGYAVEWEVSGGSPATAAGSEITVKWNPDGPYQIKAAYRQIGAGRCKSAYRIKDLASNAGDTPAITLEADSVCGGDTLNFGLNFTPSDVEWEILTDKGGSILNDRFGSEINIQFSADSTRFVSIKASGSVCNTNFVLVKEVFVKSFPIPSINFSDNNPCPGVPVTFTTNVSDPEWMIDSLIYNQNAPTITFKKTKTIKTKISKTNIGPGGCTVTLKNARSLSTANGPKTRISVSDPNKINRGNQTVIFHCSDSLLPIKLRAVLDGGAANNFNWFKDGQFIASGKTYTTPVFQPHGDYTLVATAPNGCTDTAETYRLDSTGCGGGVGGGGTPSCFMDTTVDLTIVMDSTACNEYFISAINVTGAVFHSIKFVEDELTSISETDTGPFDLGFVFHDAGNHQLAFDVKVLKGTDTVCFRRFLNPFIEAIPNFSRAKLNCGSPEVSYRFYNETSYTGNPPTYTWDFGIGTVISMGDNPVVSFPPGFHSISLSTGVNCSVDRAIAVDAPSTASFESTAPSCQLEKVQFTNTSTGNIIQHQWKLDGKGLFDQNPEVTFEDPNNPSTQTFNPEVKLFITDENGCKDTATQILTVFGNSLNTTLSVPSGITEFCQGDSTLIRTHISFSPMNPPVSYQWSDLSTTPSIQVKETGNYRLSLTDAVGCRHVTGLVNVQVNPAPESEIVGKTVFCQGEEVHLQTHAFPGVQVDWIVDSALSGISGGTYEKLHSPGLYAFTLSSSNNQSACGAESLPFMVEVKQAPTPPLIVPDASFPLCEGNPMNLNAGPSGGAYYWNTGANGNSINTGGLPGTYKAFLSDENGCTSSNSINIHPLPDFSNFITGCYCLPASQTPLLPGINRADSFQWKKNGLPIPPPDGILEDLPASTGLFELIAVSEEGCIDSAGVLDISLGGCENCAVSLSDFEINCSSNGQDSLIYDFSLQLNLAGDSALSHEYLPKVKADGQVMTILSMQPDSLSAGMQTLSGTFYMDSLINPDSICFSTIVPNNGKSCQASVCLTKEPLACEFIPKINFDVNPFSCVLSLAADYSGLGQCQFTEHADYNWTIVQNGDSINSTDSLLSMDSLQSGNASVCLQIELFNPLDSSTCLKDTCIVLTIPDCSCDSNCTNASVSTAEFTQFDFRGDSCVLEYLLILDNPAALNISINHLGSEDGSLLSLDSIAADSILVEFYPNQPWVGGQACFDLFLADGSNDCCLPFCLDLPRCDCDLSLNNLSMNCSGPDDPLNWFDFSFTADLDASQSFNFTTDLIVTNQSGTDTAEVLFLNPDSLSKGMHLISGRLQIDNPTPGELYCYHFTSELGGMSCQSVICDSLPPAICSLTPSFIADFDPFTCGLTLTNTTVADSCSRLDSSDIQWSVELNQTFIDSGQIVTFFNLSDPEGENNAEVSLSVSGIDYSGQSCQNQIIQEVPLQQCQCLDDCEDIGIGSTSFSHFADQGDSCILVFDLIVGHTFTSSFQLNAIQSELGDVLSVSTLDSGATNITYRIEFFPKQPWDGGLACFDLFIVGDGGLFCCKHFCAELPKCNCGLQLSNPEITCTSPDGNPGEFLFSFQSDLDAVGTFNYSNSLFVIHNGDTVIPDFFNPPTSTQGIQQIEGKVSLSSFSSSDSICFHFSSDLQGKACSAVICEKLPDENCQLQAGFEVNIDPISCAVTLTDTSQIDPCTYVLLPENYSWDISGGAVNYSFDGKQVDLPFLPAGQYLVCHQVLAHSYTGAQDCHPEVCTLIEVPECECSGFCEGIEIDAANFLGFEAGQDPCEANIELTLNNFMGQTISINGITSPDGQVLEFERIGGTLTSPVYDLSFRPNPVWQGGMACFKLHLKVDGNDCCIEFCVEIPECSGAPSPPLRLKAEKENFQLDQLKVYPVPAKNSLFIAWQQTPPHALQLSLLNQDGKTVLFKNILAPNAIEELPLDNLASGIYVLQLQQNDQLIRKKIVIIK